MRSVQILGKSHYALAVIIDMLYLEYGEELQIEVVSNIPESENSSREAEYKIPGLRIEEIDHQDFSRNPEALLFCGSIGRSRRTIVEFFRDHHGLQAEDYSLLVHPKAVLPEQCEVSPGFQVGPNATVAPFAAFGLHCVINRNASVGHHSRLGDYTTVNPGCTIAGLCRIGNNTTLGAGAVVLDQIEIGENTVIGAGSVVTKNIPAGVVAYGAPAKVIRERD